MEELASTVRQNADSANAANALAAGTSKTAGRGGECSGSRATSSGADGPAVPSPCQ